MSSEDETRQPTASTVQPADADTLVSGGTRPEAPAQALRRGTSVGRFIVLEPLGAGAMGEVVLAYDPDLHRRVAIKVLRPHLFDAGGSAVQRMLREARAMAKVSHPNVITVFEVDQMPSGQSFIAMEYVDGGTLRAWLSQTRSWREVLAVYRAAGEGLAAAHDEGLVHRDFKPDNVLVGSDSRVRVTDFGLVGALGEGGTTEAAENASASHSGAFEPAWDVTLTRTGTLLGTPAYMAPEDSGSLDTRSDQFSFCVALYEALYGQRPFAGDTLAELRTNVCDGKLRPVPSDADVPGWLREVVERGLAVDANERWPDMHTLLRALQRDPGQRRGKLVFGTLALATTGGAIALAATTQAPPPACLDDRTATSELWNDARSASLLEAFREANPDAAATGHASVVSAMDTFVDAWAEGRMDACQTHRVRHEQSAELFDRRMLCLNRRLERADALLNVFATPDSGTVDAAARIGGAMPSLETCADAETLRSLVPPPDAPDVRAAWKRLQLGIDHADALGVAGRHPEALAEYPKLREEIESLDHPPLEARFLQNYGNALVRSNKFAEAIALLEHAPEVAARSDDATLETNVWLLLARAHGFGLNDAKSGAWLARMAEVAAIRSREPETSKLHILFTQAVLADQAGNYTQAIRAARETTELAESVYGRAHRNTSAAWGTLGNAYDHAGQLDEAQRAHETSLEIDRGLHDEPHPDIGHSLVNLGLLDEQRGKLDAAAARYREALLIYEQTVGKTDQAYGTVLLNLAGIAANRGLAEEARRRYAEVTAFYREAGVPEGHADYATIHINLAGVALKEGELDKALAEAAQGLSIRRSALGHDHPEVLLAQAMLGRIHAARGDLDHAEAALRDALRIADASLPVDHPDRADPMITLGQVLVEAGKTKEAIPWLERALTVANPSETERANAVLTTARAQ